MASVMRLVIGRKQMIVQDFAQASAVWSQYRDERTISGSRMPEVYVTDENGERRSISYNGKVWPFGDRLEWQPGDVPLYNPYS